MNSMEIGRSFVREDIEIDRARSWIDDRRAGDAHFRRQVMVSAIAVAEVVVGHDGGNAEVGVPEQSAVWSCVGVGIEGIDAVVLGGHENRVDRALAGNDQAGKIERLGIDMAIDGVSEKTAKVIAIDSGWRQ